MPKEMTVFDIDKRSSRSEQLLEKTFIVSILFKLAFGVVEASAGILLLFVTYANITKFVEHVNSWVIFGYQPHLHTASLADQRVFVALYAILHGIPKVLMAVILIRRKLWGYPLSLAILVLFITYQLFEIITKHSVFMILLTIFDLFVMYMIMHEWKRDKAHFARLAAKEQAASASVSE